MPYAQAKRIDENIIPVIDITPLRDGGDIARVAQALHAANQGLGFVYIRGHGIPSATIERARDSAMKFFLCSDTDKSTVGISQKHRGWLARGGAKMQGDARTDFKESFIWGPQSSTHNGPHDHPLRGPNQWPKFVPELEKNAMEFFQHAHRVARQLMRGFALGLELDENFFLRHCSRPLSRASFVYYPAQPEGMGDAQFGVGPHTDFGLLTILCQDSVGGLQIRDVKGDWIHAPPIDGTLVVNVGDLLSRWTDGAYNSTPHRVVNSSGNKRISLVLAFDLDPETVIDARDIFGVDYVAKRAPITCGEYLVQRFARAFSYRNA